MAKKKAAAPTQAELWQLFIGRLADVFIEFNGKLWRVRRAEEIRAAANLIANTLALFGFARK